MNLWDFYSQKWELKVAAELRGIKPISQESKAEGGLFWDSGLWSPASYGSGPENIKFTVNYVKQQKYGSARDQAKQYSLTAFVD